MTNATLSQAIQSVFDENIKTINTSIPGQVLKFDPSTQLAEIQVGIKRVNKDGEQTAITPIIEVPVLFSGGSVFRFEHEINEGDEGILIFSQRCIDSWIDQGGVATNPILRFHDMSDAYFIPGIRSQKNGLSDFENNGVRITDGTNYFWLKNDGNTYISSPTLFIDANIVHTGNNTQTGNHSATGIISAPTMTAATSLTINGIQMDGHTHPYSWTDPAGSGNTGGAQ
jgi:hypothetical protein